MEITAKQILASAPRRFRPEKAQNVNSIFHFIISGDENFDCTLTISDGAATLSNALTGTPTCIVRTDAKTYIELETGMVSPQMALMDGRIEVSDIPEMIRFAKCFRRFDPADVTEDEQEVRNPQSVVRNLRTGPLQGVRIIDFTRLLPGPMATMMLADMGADVIKVEDPDSPDYVRNFEPMIEGTSAFYYALNRNKRSLAINFLSEKGQSVIADLVRQADIFIEQYRPGTMKKWGLHYEALRAVNPKLIYISITGYGQGSSLSEAAGHDLNYIAKAGALGLTGDDRGEPVMPGFQTADIAGGAYMTMNAVTTALYQREKTGRGEWIDIAMTDCVLPFAALAFAEYQASGRKFRRGRSSLSGGQANYNVYKCSDGKYLAMGALEPKFWSNVCDKLGKPEWREKITGNAETHSAIRSELSQIFLKKTRDEWCTLLAGDDMCISPVNELDELSGDPYLNERKLFIDFQQGGKTIKTIAQPVTFESAKGCSNWIAPRLGEDTYAILKDLNLTDDEINELRKENIIKTT